MDKLLNQFNSILIFIPGADIIQFTKHCSVSTDASFSVNEILGNIN